MSGGLPEATIIAFNSVLEKHTVAFCEAMDEFARAHHLNSQHMSSLVSLGGGDLGEIYDEWMAEAWEPEP